MIRALRINLNSTVHFEMEDGENVECPLWQIIHFKGKPLTCSSGPKTKNNCIIIPLDQRLMEEIEI